MNTDSQHQDDAVERVAKLIRPFVSDRSLDFINDLARDCIAAMPHPDDAGLAEFDDVRRRIVYVCSGASSQKDGEAILRWADAAAARLRARVPAEPTCEHGKTKRHYYEEPLSNHGHDGGTRICDGPASGVDGALADHELGALIAIAPPPFAGQRMDRTLESCVPVNKNADVLLYAAADEIRRLAAALHAALRAKPAAESAPSCGLRGFTTEGGVLCAFADPQP